MKKNKPLLGVLILTVLVIWSSCSNEKNEVPFQHITGTTMGTIKYNVKFKGEALEMKSKIDRVLVAFNQSLSTYVADSEISKLNTVGELEYESDYFLPILKVSKQVFEITDRTFDPSIGPLVQAWGFGPNKKIPNLSKTQVDSLRSITGFENVSFDSTGVSMPKNFQLDFSAIAKGYAVDLVADLLEKSGLTNYMVEIGGEVRCRGKNDKDQTWILGIEDPTRATERAIVAVARLNNKSLATSGNYRNYFEKDGRIYAHIIDPRTGYTANHNLLSASVFASTCMEADAFATAFMVLGLEASKKIVSQSNDLDAVFVFQGDEGELKVHVSDGMKTHVQLKPEISK